jgi:hypothetical protein
MLWDLTTLILKDSVLIMNHSARIQSQIDSTEVNLHQLDHGLMLVKLTERDHRLGPATMLNHFAKTMKLYKIRKLEMTEFSKDHLTQATTGDQAQIVILKLREKDHQPGLVTMLSLFAKTTKPLTTKKFETTECSKAHSNQVTTGDLARIVTHNLLCADHQAGHATMLSLFARITKPSKIKKFETTECSKALSTQVTTGDQALIVTHKKILRLSPKLKQTANLEKCPATQQLLSTKKNCRLKWNCFPAHSTFLTTTPLGIFLTN